MAPFLEKCRLRPGVAEVGELTGWILAICAKHSIPDKTAFALQLCLDETIANIIEHGKSESYRVTEVSICVAQEDADVVMTVVDDGEEFDPTRFEVKKPPRSLDDMPVGGAGIRLMRKFATNISYERRNNRNCLHFVFAPAA
jgi:anti-sigma regulatory factor (Ser/Thr protein kinase)